MISSISRPSRASPRRPARLSGRRRSCPHPRFGVGIQGHPRFARSVPADGGSVVRGRRRPPAARVRPSRADLDRHAGRHPALPDRADGPDRDLGPKRDPRGAFSRSFALDLLLRRAGASLGRVPSAVRGQRPLLRRLHEHRRQHGGGTLPRLGGSERGGPFERRHAPDDPPALRQPQRRRAAVRAGRLSLHRHGRRRVRERPDVQRSRTTGLCSASCCGST